MNALVYLLQVSACTAIFYLFYYLLLSRLTFFTLNRWYLLVTLFLSFVIPVLNIPVNPEEQHIAVVQQAVYVNTLQTIPISIIDIQPAVTTAKPINWMLIAQVCYFTAVIALAVHLILTLIIFFKRLKGKQITKVGHINILRSAEKLHNGSFFNYIFLNDEELSADEMQQIIAHEMLHVKLFHSTDRLLVKITQVILWFNPFIYFYAKAIEENHEFEVDCAMANSTDKKLYADLLLHLSVTGQGLLYHSFSKIPLKKRITMLFNQPSAKMKKVIYVLILPVVLISCLAFAKLKKDQVKNNYSVIKGVKKLGENPLVLIDGKVYGKDILYTIEDSCIASSAVWSPNPHVKKHGVIIKDGFVDITTKNGKISYLTPIEKENLAKESSVSETQIYTRLKLQKQDGSYSDKVTLRTKVYKYSYLGISPEGKIGFLVNKKIYDEETINKLPLMDSGSFKGMYIDRETNRRDKPNIDLSKYEIVFQFTTKADSIKYRQKLKRTPAQIKGEADFKAWRETDDFKERQKIARDVQGKTINVKIKDVVDRNAEKSDIFISNKGKVQGFIVVYNNNAYFMRTNYRQEKQLDDILKVGDEITITVRQSTFGRNSLNMIDPANIYKDNVKVFQSIPINIDTDYAFLYESNRVRFADGQITNIQNYPNGKWKSAVLEIVNGYKLNLNFKSTAPDFSSIKENDQVRFRFVHEVKTGAKSYQISDWVSISNDIKDYGIKNPEFFYKFYEPTVARIQETEHNFKVTKLTYSVPENVLLPLKKDQPNSYVSVGKTINVTVLKKEQERVYKFLAAMLPHIEKKNIVFNVDTTAQKGFCTVKTVVKPLT